MSQPHVKRYDLQCKVHEIDYLLPVSHIEVRNAYIFILDKNRVHWSLCTFVLVSEKRKFLCLFLYVVKLLKYSTINHKPLHWDPWNFACELDLPTISYCKSDAILYWNVAKITYLYISLYRPIYPKNIRSPFFHANFSPSLLCNLELWMVQNARGIPRLAGNTHHAVSWLV